MPGRGAARRRPNRIPGPGRRWCDGHCPVAALRARAAGIAAPRAPGPHRFPDERDAAGDHHLARLTRRGLPPACRRRRYASPGSAFVGGKTPVTIQPGDQTAPGAGGRGHLRASHADREQVIGALKAAFVAGMLAKDEFDLRVGQTLASRTYAELAALTADIPAEPAAAQPLRPARAQGEQPVLQPGPVIMATTALYAGVWAFTLLPPWPTNSEGDPPSAIIVLLFLSTLIYPLLLAVAGGYMIAGWREKRSGGRPPRRPEPGAGGQASPGRRSAAPDRQLPPIDPGQRHRAQAVRNRLPRQPLPPRRGHPLGRPYATS